MIATGGSETRRRGRRGHHRRRPSVWLLNVIFRVGVQGERERDAEDEARDFYGAHGYWPDEAPPPDSGASPHPTPEHPDDRRQPAHPHRSPARPGTTARRPPRRP